MAKLYFRYGAMGSSKSANALMVQYNYIERGQSALLLKPRMDNRGEEGTISSRAGLSARCSYIEDLDDIDVSRFDCLIVDEAQFLSKAQVEKLSDIVDELGIPVICYGLRADFRGELFEGSRCLLSCADTIEEIKTVCWCGKKAMYNARIANGRVVKSGEQILIGGNESYAALCRRHWKKGELAPAEIRRIDRGLEAYAYFLDGAGFGGWKDADTSYMLFESGAPSSVCSFSGNRLLYVYTQAEKRNEGRAGKLIRHALALARDDVYLDCPPSVMPFFSRFGFEGENGRMLRKTRPTPATASPSGTPRDSRP